MDVRRRQAKPTSSPVNAGEPLKVHSHVHRQFHHTSPTKSSDVLTTVPLYLTNGLFFTMFFSVAYYLLHRWRDKIRNSTPLHVVTLPEIAAIVALFASVVYLLGFFGIDFVLSLIDRPSHDAWYAEEEQQEQAQKPTKPPCAGFPPPTNIPAATATSNMANEDDEEIVKSVVAGTTPSYSLESRLGDCKRAAKIRREAVQRGSGRSLEGLPTEGFDYESILGQCCEMPVGYVQIPVGVAGPLLLDGKEYTVPMATTEGCLVASTNRGCKAIYASGGATCFLLRDAMTRAPVVRFSTAKRAAQLKFFVEDPLNFDTLSVVFNRFFSFIYLLFIFSSSIY